MGTDVTEISKNDEVKRKHNEIVVTDGENIPLLYADQIAKVAVGPQVCKLFLTLEDGEAKDGKQPVRTSALIVLPTNSLIQFCQTVVNNMITGGDALLEANNELRKNIESLKTKVPASKK